MNHPLNTRRYTELVSKMSYALSLLCKYLEKKIEQMDEKQKLKKRISTLEEEISDLKKLSIKLKEHIIYIHESSDK